MPGLEYEECTNCGGNITPEPDSQYEVCPHCGTSYRVGWVGNIPILEKIGSKDNEDK